MNIRQSWLNDDSENLSSLFYSKEETIASVKEILILEDIIVLKVKKLRLME